VQKSDGAATPPQTGQFGSFLLRFNYLSYAFHALLRRNIIAFHALRYAYVPAIKRCAGATPETIEKRTTMLASLVRFIRDYRSYNRSVVELTRLGDRELADIGISRSDIARVAWNAAHER
jgi:uncharacterized protein YjiS (DUF1127 family)